MHSDCCIMQKIVKSVLINLCNGKSSNKIFNQNLNIPWLGNSAYESIDNMQWNLTCFRKPSWTTGNSESIKLLGLLIELGFIEQFPLKCRESNQVWNVKWQAWDGVFSLIRTLWNWTGSVWKTLLVTLIHFRQWKSQNETSFHLRYCKFLLFCEY